MTARKFISTINLYSISFGGNCMIRNWDDLPDVMKNDCVLKYYYLLNNKKVQLFFKRLFDILVSLILIILFLPIFIIISVLVKIDSKGQVMFRQVRVTQYGKQFRIYKFRTMVNNTNKIGAQVTAKNDSRVTKVGKVLRKLRLDEIPQLLNIISGDMTFVGTRPEVVKYVERYSCEMMATLLLPAGVTSEASIQYKDEGKFLENAEDVDETYINEVLPGKMKYNLRSIEKYSFFGEIMIIIRTVGAVAKKDKAKSSHPKTSNREVNM